MKSEPLSTSGSVFRTDCRHILCNRPSLSKVMAGEIISVFGFTQDHACAWGYYPDVFYQVFKNQIFNTEHVLGLY